VSFANSLDDERLLSAPALIDPQSLRTQTLGQRCMSVLREREVHRATPLASDCR
jgi:hypothetical protein